MIIKKALRPDCIELHKAIPLETPFTLNVTTNNYCNFKCVYCYQSLERKVVEENFGKKQALTLESFKKAVDGMSSFKQRFKVFNFCGTGETILTPQLAEMIKYANEKNVVERTNIVTNAYALTHELSDALIDAGLGSLRVSIQGLDAKKYQEICGVKIDMERFLEQLKYFYDHRKDCKVHIKIIDIALGDYTQQDFYDMYGKYSDFIAVEHFIPNDLISYDDVHVEERDTTVHGFKKHKVDVCFSAFYALTLDMNGDIYPCCANPKAGLLGNVNSDAVYNMWNSKKMKEFWKMQLTDRCRHPVCSKCDRPSNAVQDGDDLDNYKTELLQRLEK